MKGTWGRSMAVSLFSVWTLLSLPVRSQDLVAQAWRAWEANDQEQVEQKFLAAIQADPNNVRAYLGLSLLYEMQDKPGSAWRFFQPVLDKTRDPHPYLFSAWVTPKFRNNLDSPESGAFKVLEALSEKADEAGILKAMANEVLAEKYEERGDLSKGRRQHQKVNAIKTWTVIGPFDNISASGFENVFPPEAEYNPAQIYEGKNGIPTQWFAVTATRNDSWIDHLRYFAYTGAVYYANNFIYSSQKQKVQIRIGTSGSLKAFLNDELLFEYFDENNSDLDTYVLATELQAGWNRVLIKCGYSEISQCNFAVRITDAHGEPVPGLQVSLDPQVYAKRPGAPVAVIPNFAETYFQQQIKAYPEHLENYALLADCYLRNDKAIEAELVLREAISRTPNCALFHEKIVEAFRRGEKYDEVSTTVERIYALDKDVPSVLEYKFERYLENEDYEPAEELLARFNNLLPGSIRSFELTIGLYTKKQQFDKVIELVHEAYRQHPTHWNFAYLEAVIAVQATRKYDQAIKIMQAYLKKHNNKAALTTLADFYLKASEVKNWEETFHKALALDPAATGYYHKMTEVFLSLQRYGDAEENIRRALAICPNSTGYWQMLGQIKRIQGEREAAKQAYSEALRFHPTNYEAREVLRELEGKQSVFAHFEAANLAELVRNAPPASEYPEDHGVVLLSETKRVVYEQGASESLDELLVKLYDSEGIDDYKEYWIGYNSFTETLTIDKAVVIKKDGAEIEADLNDNHVVFKALEENDCIYLKWRIKNYYNGKLSNHFWDTFYFNGFYPIKKIRYGLLVPEGRKFQFKAQNMKNTPVRTETSDGVRYQWSLHDEPAVIYEPAMPTLADVGKVLHVSSIENWDYLVQWYSDLARAKTRSSHEIKKQVAELFKDRNDLSENERIRTIYNYITENIRYSNVPFRQSRLVPQKARDVLVSKIGDCKDMTTLCIAMLNEAGINAHYLLLNTTDAGQNRETPPSIAFNHCLASVETSQGVKYLDLTASNYALGTLPEGNLEGFALLIQPEIKTPHYLAREESAPANTLRNSTVHVRDDNGILVETRSHKSGALAAGMRSTYRFKSQKDREKILTQMLSDDFLNPKVLKFQIDSLEHLRSEIEYAYDFEVPNYVMETPQFNLLKLPWSDALTKQYAPTNESRKFPYGPWLWADTLQENLEINLPAGWKPDNLKWEYQDSCSVASYAVAYRFENGVLRAQRRLICRNRTVPPEAYSGFKAFYANVVREDERRVLLKK